VKELALAVGWIQDPAVQLLEEYRRLRHHMQKVTTTPGAPANDGKSEVSQ
jgi:hypothetical protein